MESRRELVHEKHKSGCNCCQAIVCSYSDLFGIDEDTAFKMSEGFGAGMGNRSSTCGAVTGAIMIAGMKNSEGTSNKKTKATTLKMSGTILEKFEEMNGTSICRELKGADTGKMIRSCTGCIDDAIQIVEEYVLGDE